MSLRKLGEVRRTRAATALLVAVFVTAGCGGQPKNTLTYHAAATLDCLKHRPEWTPTARPQLSLYVDKVTRDPDTGAPALLVTFSEGDYRLENPHTGNATVAFLSNDHKARSRYLGIVRFES